MADKLMGVVAALRDPAPEVFVVPYIADAAPLVQSGWRAWDDLLALDDAATATPAGQETIEYYQASFNHVRRVLSGLADCTAALGALVRRTATVATDLAAPLARPASPRASSTARAECCCSRSRST